mmetsp:Transcript_35051/g.96822  ORF Transcript_35051/g.96822 Transcript_35051/m.96822 type:complete len:271 (-) Transcript_35051:530-1342(-)
MVHLGLVFLTNRVPEGGGGVGEGGGVDPGPVAHEPLILREPRVGEEGVDGGAKLLVVREHRHVIELVAKGVFHVVRDDEDGVKGADHDKGGDDRQHEGRGEGGDGDGGEDGHRVEQVGVELHVLKGHGHLLHLGRVVVREQAVGNLLEDTRHDGRRCADAARVLPCDDGPLDALGGGDDGARRGGQQGQLVFGESRHEGVLQLLKLILWHLILWQRKRAAVAMSAAAAAAVRRRRRRELRGQVEVEAVPAADPLVAAIPLDAAIARLLRR